MISSYTLQVNNLDQGQRVHRVSREAPRGDGGPFELVAVAHRRCVSLACRHELRARQRRHVDQDVWLRVTRKPGQPGWQRGCVGDAYKLEAAKS